MPNGEQGWLQKWWEDFLKLKMPTYGYQHWREPYYEQAGWLPRPKAVAPPPTAYDIYQEAGGRYPVSKYPNLPESWTTPLPEGKEWRQYAYNPQTFEPLAEPEWFMVSKEEGEEKRPWQAPAFPTTRQAGGFTFMPQYDLEGNIIGWETIGRTPEAPIEPVEPEVIREGLTSEQLRSMSLEFDVWKAQVLRDPTLAGPAGWIRRYMIEQVQNPFTYEKQRAIHRRKVLRAGKEEKEAARFAKAGGGVWQPTRTRGKPERVSPGEAAEYAKQKRKATTRVGRREPMKPPTPTLPVTPAGLAQFVPGLVTGQPITKQEVMIPSGQKWMATPWSQREQLRGYMGWTGQPYPDILEQMARMQPEEPTGVRKKWYRPARQWA